MTKRQAIEELDNSMRDIMGRSRLPFGGKTIVFGGDFRQVLPVVRKGSRAQIVAASLRSSYLWESMCHIKLFQNMRAQSDPWFAEYLLCVGGGTEEANNDGDVCLPDEFKRKQFPIRLSFAMTVNKAQGQTIPNVGVYLSEPVFSHGQLYVALSRTTARSKVKILAIPVHDEKKKKKGVERNSAINGATYTKNIVYKEDLTP
ncbi:PIF1-like helicase [Zea mays]|uniref:ATP-dependent DNA helicase n=1 Tax=Zea mays TaxID=4577 RepID=A0A1D6L2J9_MAIZE|nr:PIF1-like helicase [Zea mays]